MGGYRSGGHNSRGRIIAEGAMRLDLRELRRREALAPGRCGSIEWKRSDGSSFSVEFTVGSYEIWLSYTCTDLHSGQLHPVTELIRLDWESCRFGGKRCFFECPGCAANVVVLYCRSGWFRCRVCARVAYASQNERPMDRAMRQERKIRYRLGDSEWLDSLPERPKGMWRRTYSKLTNRLVAANHRADMAWLQRVQALLQRHVEVQRLPRAATRTPRRQR
jgi:hypothetical protein